MSLSKDEIKLLFHDYFTKANFQYVKPHSLVPPDNTILFTNSGMNLNLYF